VRGLPAVGRAGCGGQMTPRILTDDHFAHQHCGCCGRCFAWLKGVFCYQCCQIKEHLGPAHLPPWDRTYEAVHGTLCPFYEPVMDRWVVHREPENEHQI
jgi:hypothetical protein